MKDKDLHLLAETLVYFDDAITKLQLNEAIVETIVKSELENMTEEQFKRCYFYKSFEEGWVPNKRVLENYEFLKNRFFKGKKK